MSYRTVRRRVLGLAGGGPGPGPGMTPFANPNWSQVAALDPYAHASPPGTIYAPYGWGPGAPIGLPATYAYHVGYERTPIGPHDHLGHHGIYQLVKRAGATLNGLGLLPLLAVL